MTKATLRSHFKELRSRLSTEEKLSLEGKLLMNLRNAVSIHNKTVHTFLPIKKFNEPDTFPLLQDESTTWVVSKANFDNHSMQHFVYDKFASFKESPQGIPEPLFGKEIGALDIDIVLTPLLAADMRGYRVGYGKGFYDRFFTNCKKDILKVGLSFFEPIDEISDANETDIRLDMLITPTNQYYF